MKKIFSLKTMMLILIISGIIFIMSGIYAFNTGTHALYGNIDYSDEIEGCGYLIVGTSFIITGTSLLVKLKE